MLNLRQDRAVALHRNGESDKAEAELATLIAERELTASPGDYAMRHARQWHARVLLDCGRFDEAEPELRRLSEECDRPLGTDDPEAVDMHENHATALAKLNRVGEAEAEMAVVAKRTAAAAPDDAATLKARSTLALFDALGRLDDSETAWRELAEAKARVLGAGHPDAILALSRHAHVLYEQRRLEEAAAEYRQVEAQRTATLGADHPDAKRARDWQAAIERQLEAPSQ